MKPSESCRHALFLFGVLVGLAIKEAITRVGPHLLSYETNHYDHMSTEGLRLAVFGLMIVRHYLGAVDLFHGIHERNLAPKIHPAINVDPTRTDAELQELRTKRKTALREESRRQRVAQTQFGYDFISGLVHFVAFSIWSLTIAINRIQVGASPPPDAVPEAAYRYLLVFILVYDVFWLWQRPRPQPVKVRRWRSVNLGTAIVVTAWYKLAVLRWHQDSLSAEVIPLLFVALISMIDIMQLTMSNDFFIRSLVVVVKAPLKFIGGFFKGAHSAVEKAQSAVEKYAITDDEIDDETPLA